MALTAGSLISATDFNNLRTRAIDEATRRSSSGDSYNVGPVTIPTINTETSGNKTMGNRFTDLLTFLSNFNVFPGLLHSIYTDAVAASGEKMYSINNIDTILTSLENEDRVSNDDCNTSCTGLCTNSCANACTGCTGECTGTCKGCTSCSGGCQGGCGWNCTEYCGGCVSCSGECGGSGKG